MGRRGSQRTGYYWDGLQFTKTTILSTGNAFVLVDATALEFMPSTLTRIRGQLALGAISTASNTVQLKILEAEVNDAGTMTGDHAGIDTHEEDIAVRQLWTGTFMQQTVATDDGFASADIDIDVRVKLKLKASGKKLLLLLADATTSTRTEMAGYLRCLLQHS